MYVFVLGGFFFCCVAASSKLPHQPPPPPPKAAAARFSAFRCLLNRRAVAAAPSKNPTARTAPPGPGSCYDQ